MPTITKSIGTASRDYSTIAAWEADLDNSGIYASGDKAVGECYNDSTFSLNSEITINGGGTRGLSEVVLSVATGQRHTGTAGTGARIVRTGNGRTINQDGGVKTTIEWLEFDYAGYAGTDQTGCIYSKRTFAGTCIVKNILLHDMAHSGSFGRMSGIRSMWTKFYVQNCIVYDMSVTDNNNTWAIASDSDSSGEVGIFHNNTVYKFTNGGTNAAITVGGNSEAAVRNCIAVGNTKDFSGAGSSGTYSNNLSSDTTAPGTSSLTSKTATNQFVSIVNGSEDLHLKATADAKDAGVDLATSPPDVQFDIDGRNRDSEGDTWDIGADEYVSTSTTADLLVPVFRPLSNSLRPARRVVSGFSITSPVQVPTSTHTGIAAVTVGAATCSGSATSTDPIYAGNAAVTCGAATCSGTATSADPIYSGNAAVTCGATTASGTATSTAPIYSGNAAVTVGAATCSGAATFTDPIYSGNAAVTVGATTASGTAQSASAIYSGNAAVTCGAATASGTATHTTPIFTGLAAVVTAAVTASGSATHTAPIYSGNAAVVTGPAIATGTATFTSTTRTGTAVVTTGAVIASGTATFVAPAYDTGTGYFTGLDTMFFGGVL